VIISVASRRGSPGATLLACLLAQCWPAEDTSDDGTAAFGRRYVLEADVAGGVLAARWQHTRPLAWEPGLLELAASRSTLSSELLDAHSQPLTGSVRLLPARPQSAQVAAALNNFGAAGADALSALRELVFVDCGRLVLGSPAMALARASALTLLVFRPTLEEVQAVLVAVSELQSEGMSVGLVSVGDKPFHPREVQEHAGVEFCVQVADDARGATALRTRGLDGRGVRRTPLWRSARALAEAAAADARVLDQRDGLSDVLAKSGAGARR